MFRIIFVNRYFYPDLSATSQILTDLAIHLAGEGFDVTVITGRQRYTEPASSLPRREIVAGVRVIRISATNFGRGRLLGRALDYATFHIFAVIQLLASLRRGDVVVAKTDPPLVSVVAALVARTRGAKQVNWLQDLFPEVAVILEPRWISGWLAKTAKRARDWSLRNAEVNVVLGELMAGRVRALGVPAKRICTIPNWTDDRKILPLEHKQNPLRSEWRLEDKFVIAYSGNLGRAHEFGTILESAHLLQDCPAVVFLIIGAGAQLPQVRRFIAQHKLGNVIERPYQPRNRLACSLAVADLHLISLIPQLEGLIVPSKFYGIAAAQRPTAFIGDVNGEIATLLARFDCGRSFQVGNGRGLAEFIKCLVDNPQRCERMGRNARFALEAEWSQAKAFERWRSVFVRMRTMELEKFS